MYEFLFGPIRNMSDRQSWWASFIVGVIGTLMVFLALYGVWILIQPSTPISTLV